MAFRGFDSVNLPRNASLVNIFCRDTIKFLKYIVTD